MLIKEKNQLGKLVSYLDWNTRLSMNQCMEQMPPKKWVFWLVLIILMVKDEMDFLYPSPQSLSPIVLHTQEQGRCKKWALEHVSNRTC